MVYAYSVRHDYDYYKSTEDHYACDTAEFVGKYRAQRSMLDYSHHKKYSEERQLLHDQLIDQFLSTRVRDHRYEHVFCEAPTENWILFTAGPMGAGKGHTIQWLADENVFPLDAFVNVNPDIIRELLPEFDGYVKHNTHQMGFLTQKEAGYISEVLTYDALLQKKNVMVDGSLRDVKWYSTYFQKLRSDFPLLRIAIFYVTSRLETVLLRARRRAVVTGRVVPEDFLTMVYFQIPESLKQLGRLADFYARISNEDKRDPCLETCTMRARVSSLELKQRMQEVETTRGRESHSTAPLLVLKPQKVLWALEHMAESVYLFTDAENGTEELEDGWHSRFLSVWEMQCPPDDRRYRLLPDYGHHVHLHDHQSQEPAAHRRPSNSNLLSSHSHHMQSLVRGVSDVRGRHHEHEDELR